MRGLEVWHFKRVRVYECKSLTDVDLEFDTLMLTNIQVDKWRLLIRVVENNNETAGICYTWLDIRHLSLTLSKNIGWRIWDSDWWGRFLPSLDTCLPIVNVKTWNTRFVIGQSTRVTQNNYESVTTIKCQEENSYRAHNARRKAPRLSNCLFLLSLITRFSSTGKVLSCSLLKLF